MSVGFLYNRGMEYKILKKVLFSMQCPADKKHMFDKVFELEEGQEKPEKETGVEAFCPFCGKLVEAAVKGKAKLNEEILKRFEEQKKRFAKQETR